MANSIDDILKKSSPEQQEKFKQLAKEFDAGITKAEDVGQDHTPAAIEKETKAISDPQRSAEETQKIQERNPPAQGEPQTPTQTKTEQNTIDTALSNQTKEVSKEQGQTLTRQGINDENAIDRAQARPTITTEQAKEQEKTKEKSNDMDY